MGGYGAYATGLHSVGDWAAVAAIAGRTDFYVWFDIKRADLPPWKRILFDADDPRTLELNARNTPFLVQHGALDGVVPVIHSRLIAADARVVGLPLRYLEESGATHASVQVEAIERAFAWFETQKPLAAAALADAGRGRFARGDKPLGAHRSLRRLQPYRALGRDGSGADKIVIVKTDNVARFRAERAAEFLPRRRARCRSKWTAFRAQINPSAPVEWSAPDALSWAKPRPAPGRSKVCCATALFWFMAMPMMRWRRVILARAGRNWADGDAPIKSAAASHAVRQRRRQPDFVWHARNQSAARPNQPTNCRWN